MKNNNRHKKVIFFWMILIIVLIISSLMVKTFLGLKNSFYRNLSRTTLLYKNNEEKFIFSFENDSTLIIEDLPEQKKETSVLTFGYFVDNNNLLIKKKINKSFFKQILKLSFFGKINTNLNRFDLTTLYFKLLSLKDDEFKTLKVDEINKDTLKDFQVRKEALTIAILNLTLHSGLAQQAAKEIENYGGRVIFLSDSQEYVENCKILYLNGKEESYTFFWLKKAFGCSTNVSSDQSGRTDLTLMVGEGYWKNREEKW